MSKPGNLIHRLLSVSLKWKLLIPFLFFAFSGTSLLTLIGLTSQQNLIRDEEKEKIQTHYRYFLEQVNQLGNQSIALASMIAENRQVQKLLAERDREGLIHLLRPTFIRMKRDFHIKQFHFYIPPATSFLRLHEPGKYGDDLGPTRQTVRDALTEGVPCFGLEKGLTGFGVRGVVPVYHRGEIVGAVGIGHSFGKAFLEDFRKRWNMDAALYEIKGKEYPLLAIAGDIKGPPLTGADYGRIQAGKRVIMIAPEKFPRRAFLFGPVKNYSNKVVAIVRLSSDRSEVIEKFMETRNLMLTVGLAGILISFVLTYLVIMLFIRPIKEIVREAKDIALGKRESRLDPKPGDEIGVLTEALNTMLEALKKRRKEIEAYAENLEKQVQDRTAELVASEEKYRTLVENVPLVVYRVLRNGTTEFVNSYMTEKLGYTIEEAVSDRRFWRDKISGADLSTYDAINERCFRQGEECRVESKVKAKDGRVLDFITHAIPTKDESGRVMWVDGIMMDITELKKLQEKALQSEEIRTLGEISASMAHEIRNPLSAAGGFARRLKERLHDDDPNKKIAGIIVNEVEKLENFLEVLLSSIKPFELVLSNVNINSLLGKWTSELKGILDSRRIAVHMELESDLPEIRADEERLSQAFENIIKHAVISIPDGGSLSISTAREQESVVVLITHNVERLSDDDLEKFFFPHIEDVEEWSVQDLPLSKIIIHRHGGILNLMRVEDNRIQMRIEFPLIAEGETPLTEGEGK